MNELKQEAEMTQGVSPPETLGTEGASQLQFASDYAPLKPDGALPPAVGKDLVRRVYEKIGLSLLANLTGPGKQVPSLRGPAYIVLRSRLNDPEFRQHLRQTSIPTRHMGEKVCGFELNLYFQLCLKARGVYSHSIKPAERLRNGIPYLEPTEFARLVKRRWKPLKVAGTLKSHSDQEHLALFVLAFGLLQPDDASALVRPLLSLGVGFREFFKVQPAISGPSPAASPLGLEGVNTPLQFQPLSSLVVSHATPSSARSPPVETPCLEEASVDEDFGRRLDEFEQARGALHALQKGELPLSSAAVAHLATLRGALAACERTLLSLQGIVDRSVARWRFLRTSLMQLGAELQPEPALAGTSHGCTVGLSQRAKASVSNSERVSVTSTNSESGCSSPAWSSTTLHSAVTALWPVRLWMVPRPHSRPISLMLHPRGCPCSCSGSSRPCRPSQSHSSG